MSEANKALFRRFIQEVINDKNTDKDGHTYRRNLVGPQPTARRGSRVEGMKQMMGMFFAAFPDLNVTIDQLIAEGDIVVGRMTNTGTHQGDLMGIAPTGKRVTFSEIHMVRIENGKAVEHWGNIDDPWYDAATGSNSRELVRLADERSHDLHLVL